jgi:hypothetical protein
MNFRLNSLRREAYAKANSAWNVESLRGLMSKTDASKVSSEMSREEIGKYFGQDAADAYDDKEKLNSIISKKLPKLTARFSNARESRERR